MSVHAFSADVWVWVACGQLYLSSGRVLSFGNDGSRPSVQDLAIASEPMSFRLRMCSLQHMASILAGAAMMRAVHCVSNVQGATSSHAPWWAAVQAAAAVAVAMPEPALRRQSQVDAPRLHMA